MPKYVIRQERLHDDTQVFVLALECRRVAVNDGNVHILGMQFNVIAGWGYLRIPRSAKFGIAFRNLEGPSICPSRFLNLEI